MIRPLDVSHIGFGDRRPRASAADGSASVVQLPKRGDVKSAEEIMEILEAYDLTGSLRDAELVGCLHHTVAGMWPRGSSV